MKGKVFDALVCCEVLYANEVTYLSAQIDRYMKMQAMCVHVDPKVWVDVYEELQDLSRRLVDVGLKIRRTLFEIGRLM